MAENADPTTTNVDTAQAATPSHRERPSIRERDLADLIEYVNAQAVALLACKEVYDLPGDERKAHGELLAELAPQFIREYRVDKVQRRIEVEFFALRSRIEGMEAALLWPTKWRPASGSRQTTVGRPRWTSPTS